MRKAGSRSDHSSAQPTSVQSSQVPIAAYILASARQNQQNGCAPSENSDQPGDPSSLISLRCSLNGKLRTRALFMRTKKALIRLGGCPGWSVFAGRTSLIVGFVVRWLLCGSVGVVAGGSCIYIYMIMMILCRCAGWFDHFAQCSEIFLLH